MRRNSSLMLRAIILLAISIIIFIYYRYFNSFNAKSAAAGRVMNFSEAVEHRLNEVAAFTNHTTSDIGPRVTISAINCSLLFIGDEIELQKADEYHSKIKTQTDVANEAFIELNCTNYRSRRQFIMSAVREERTFPLAFSILTYTQVGQFERLLRAIYRPQNYYCIHVDKASPEGFYKAVTAIAACFNNVFVVSKQVRMIWGHYSVLEADLLCMESLLRYKSWKYFINLTGMEFPLKTNWDIVKIVRALNGANDVQGITEKMQTPRIRSRWNWAKEHPPPHNITNVKGEVHVTLSRAFVEFMFDDKVALEFREWIKNTRIPDEHYMQSLNYNAQLTPPGGYAGNPDYLTSSYLSRYKIWKSPQRKACLGTSRNWICVFGIRDLAFFPSRKELFANKFLLDFQPLTYDCLEEWHFQKIRDEYAGRRHFNTSYYEQLEIVKNHITV